MTRRQASWSAALDALSFLLAALYINTLLTFENVASTLWIRLTPRISIELLAGIALLAALRASGARLPAVTKALVAMLLLLASLVRYVLVTAPGVLGRDLDAYGDLPHLPSVVGVFGQAISTSAATAVASSAILLLVLVLTLNWLAVSTLERALALRRLRQAAVAGVLIAVTSAVAGHALSVRASLPLAQPVALLLHRQLQSLGGPDPSSSPTFESLRLPIPAGQYRAPGLPGLQGADVFIIFLESYGVTLFDDAHHLSQIEPRIARFEQRLIDNGFSVISNQILSPTFAGGSWRAHATVLSGIRLSDERLYEMLLRSDHKTLVHIFREAGYRTVTAEPAITSEWPEGRFFQFDAFYDAGTRANSGPTIGWWKIPDQFTLFRIYTEEIEKARQPLFVKMALIMTHIPYFPIPPYVEDWSRFESGTAYKESLPSIAADDYRDLTELSSRYVQAFIYELDILEDFIVEFVPPDALVILAGDHQPPKLATHNNDSWAVPMQLISRRRELVKPFYEHGFRDGMVPRHSSDFAMEDFLPAFLGAFR